jgi:hypothetical protein
MNIVKLQNELKGVPDEALIGYVKNPNGQVPTYLALSELQRRKEMRNSYEAQKGPEKSVAQGLVDEAQPQPQPQGIAAMPPQQAPVAEQGVAGLPIPDQMFSGQGMAAGGIVAFDDGGDVSNYGQNQASLNLNALPSLNLGDGSSGRSEMMQKIITGFANMGRMDPSPGVRKAGNLMSEGLSNPQILIDMVRDPQVLVDKVREEKASSMALGGDVKGYAGPEGSYVQSDTPTSRIDTMYKLLSGAPYKFYRSLAESTANVPYGAARSQFPGLPENIFHKNVLGGEPGAGLFGTSTPREYPSGDKIPGANIAPTADTITGAKPAEESTKPAVADDPFAALKKTLAAGPTEKPKSMQDYAAEYKQALGEDPTVQGAKDRLAKMEARAADREEKSGWMALAKAGLTMAAGKSPRAIQNIAEGATAGVNDYVSAQEKLDTLREKHFELQSQLDRQARAEQVSATTYGANSKERAEDRAAREKLEKMSLGNQLAIAQLNYGLNTQNKLVANRDKAIDNAMQKAKIIAEQKGISDATEFDAIYQPLLAQELASLGVTGTGSTYKPPVSGMLQTTKDGVLNYVRNAAK